MSSPVRATSPGKQKAGEGDENEDRFREEDGERWGGRGGWGGGGERGGGGVEELLRSITCDRNRHHCTSTTEITR